MTQQAPQRPAREFRIGGTITASVWENTVQQGGNTVVRRSVQLQKRYKDKTDGKWKTANTYFPEDLPRIQLALAQAYEWIMMQPRDAAADDATETEDVPI